MSNIAFFNPRIYVNTFIIILLSYHFTPTSLAAALHNADLIPHVGKSARENYVTFLYANEHRAFAIGPGGAWAWQSEQASPEQAEQAAIEVCEKYTLQRCIAYAVNSKLVFDEEKWVRLWGPYKTFTQAAKTTFGNKEGQRFYNLQFKDREGNQHTISDFMGKVVFVHFWGSWCPSCMNEFPSLHRMIKLLKKQQGDQVELIIMQVREPFERSVKWIDKNRYSDMPLYDSGVSSDDDDQFTLANGKKITDRAIAKRFPSSFVLDKNGVIVFSHDGPVLDWTQYLPFFKDVHQRSGVRGVSQTGSQ